ncbi:hypothetical protein D3C87_1732810 [compost metagenome]
MPVATASITQEVEVDLEHVETEDLIKELESRGHEVDGAADLDDYSDGELVAELEDRGLVDVPMNTREAIDEMFEAFRIGKKDEAIAIARRIAQDTTGRILV